MTDDKFVSLGSEFDDGLEMYSNWYQEEGEARIYSEAIYEDAEEAFNALPQWVRERALVQVRRMFGSDE